MTSTDSSPEAARSQLRGLVAPAALVDDDEVLSRHALAVWNALTEPGDGTAGRLIATLGPLAALDALRRSGPSGSSAPTGAGVSREEFHAGVKRWHPRLNATSVIAGWDVARRHGIRLVQPGDPAWPEQLTDLGPHAPLALWVRGDPGLLTRLRPSVALVGARAATTYGEHVAMEFAAELAATGLPVISGAAYGVDGAAHRAAVGVGGETVALLAGGVEKPYPSGHAHLLERIAATGAVVSEVPCGSAPTKWRFLQRNRLIAALSDATVVVEAGWRSGSLNTAAHAAALGRGLGAVPGPITSAASAGCHRLLREYDARCVTSADHVRELVGVSARMPAGDPAADDARIDDTTRVRDALSTRVWRDTGDIARRAGMAPDDVEPLLGFFALAGDVERGLQGWRRIADAR